MSLWVTKKDSWKERNSCYNWQVQKRESTRTGLTISLCQVLKQLEILSSWSSISEKQEGENSLKPQPISTEIDTYLGGGWLNVLRYKYVKQTKPRVINLQALLPYLLPCVNCPNQPCVAAPLTAFSQLLEVKIIVAIGAETCMDFWWWSFVYSQGIWNKHVTEVQPLQIHIQVA